MGLGPYIIFPHNLGSWLKNPLKFPILHPFVFPRAHTMVRCGCVCVQFRFNKWNFLNGVSTALSSARPRVRARALAPLSLYVRRAAGGVYTAAGAFTFRGRRSRGRLVMHEREGKGAWTRWWRPMRRSQIAIPHTTQAPSPTTTTVSPPPQCLSKWAGKTRTNPGNWE